MSAPVDTIAAVATPPGRGAVAIVRVSGPAVPAICQAVLGQLPKPRYALLAEFRDAGGQALDQGLALYFPAPRSYTGEHVLELQGHGGEVVADLVLQAVLAAGARPAGPGEFSQRAFLNGQLDLAQAEAVADLIAAESVAAARAALASLEGAFSDQVHTLRARLDHLRVQLEAHLDFPDDDIDAQPDTALADGLEGLRATLDTLRGDARQGALLQEGMRIALVGPPNAGKSSLLNRLLDTERAIVTDQPGTTRDVLEERYAIDGLPLVLVDTAGLRDTDDVAEVAGIARTRAVLERADRVLVVVDARTSSDTVVRLLESLGAGAVGRASVVRNKIDLTGEAPGLTEFCPPSECLEPNDQYRSDPATLSTMASVHISALTGAGVDALKGHLKALVGFTPGAGRFSARRRHLDALGRVDEALAAALASLQAGYGVELVAEDLRRARLALGSVVGVQSADELLGEIFSSFCIGK